MQVILELDVDVYQHWRLLAIESKLALEFELLIGSLWFWLFFRCEVHVRTVEGGQEKLESKTQLVGFANHCKLGHSCFICMQMLKTGYNPMISNGGLLSMTWLVERRMLRDVKDFTIDCSLETCLQRLPALTHRFSVAKAALAGPSQTFCFHLRTARPGWVRFWHFGGAQTTIFYMSRWVWYWWTIIRPGLERKAPGVFAGRKQCRCDSVLSSHLIPKIAGKQGNPVEQRSRHRSLSRRMWENASTWYGAKL